MKKILIISDSHGGNIYHCLMDFFKNDKIHKTEKNIYFGKEEDRYSVKIMPQGGTFVQFFNENIIIDLLLLQGRSAYNFYKYLNCLNDMHFTEYKTYLYLGYNDLLPMGEKFTEYKTAKQYIDNAKLLFNNPTIILPLKNNKVIKKYVYLEKIYYVFINNLIKYGKSKNIEILNIYDFIENEITEESYKEDGEHLKPVEYLNLVQYMMK
jgi:hypothetical protein